MFLVAGLGNPGEEYALTPHNLGFLVVDRLAEQHGIRVTRRDSKALVGVGEIEGREVMLAKPQTFMNLSGTSLGPLMEKHGIEVAQLVVVYDELDLLAEQHGIRVTRRDSKALVGVGEIEGREVMLAKPQTFMNLSGTSLGPLMEKHGIELGRLVIVYDELDLPWRALRIKPKGSAAGHNGMKSAIQSLQTNEIVRVRLGIHPGHPIRDGAEFVLAPISF